MNRIIGFGRTNFGIGFTDDAGYVISYAGDRKQELGIMAVIE